MKALLTSAGFENKKIASTFLELVGKPAKEIKAIFIPTAAINPDAIAVLPKCMDDLLNVGILPENIKVYDLHDKLEYGELEQYDAVYFCGGDSYYLLKRINEIHFNKLIERFIDEKGIYVGVSAGSWIATKNMQDSLNIVNCTLDVHVEHGSSTGIIDTTNCPHIRLTNNQAILIHNDLCKVIE